MSARELIKEFSKNPYIGMFQNFKAVQNSKTIRKVDFKIVLKFDKAVQTDTISVVRSLIPTAPIYPIARVIPLSHVVPVAPTTPVTREDEYEWEQL
jgi:hypothetical protein